MKLTALIYLLLISSLATGQSIAQPAWKYEPGLLRPFWEGEVVEGETVLFIKEHADAPASANLMYPISEVVSVKNSQGNMIFEEGRDYRFSADSRTLTLTADSRIPSFTPDALRRPANTQKYALSHRDGQGEILFGGQLEYAAMQTSITYRHAPNQWKPINSSFNSKHLPRYTELSRKKQPLTVVTLGDSISEGANASGMFNAPPYQPAYPELVRLGLSEQTGSQVAMHNLSVGGKDTAWGVSQVDAVVALKPDLVFLSFGMNDAASRSVEDFQTKTKDMIHGIRKGLPNCEFILVASMLGNHDWTRLNHDAFPKYRDALKTLREPGIALADLTEIWTRFLEMKKDCDQTGNGVNHPNDFGHRVYAQVILSILKD